MEKKVIQNGINEVNPLLDDLPAQVLIARNRLKGRLLKTPLMYSANLSSMSEGAKVYIKMESEQSTGSCKARGAFNKIYKLSEIDKDITKKGVVVASSGNYGLACLEVCKNLNIPLKIVILETIGEAKRVTLTENGAKLILYGENIVGAETKATNMANETGAYFLSPYNDVDVMAGQGTIGFEILEDLPEVDYILVSVGGGGTIAGISSYIKQVKPSVKIIACQPRNSKVMYESVKAGKIISTESFQTISDGTNSGGLAENSLTFPFCRDYVDEWILVEEEQIERAVLFMLRKQHKMVEGAAGTAIGAYMSNTSKFIDKNVVVVSCGSNISVTTLQSIIRKHMDRYTA